MPYQFFKRLGGMASVASTMVKEMYNPKIGHQLLELRVNSYALRFHGGESAVDEVAKAGGIIARRSIESIKTVTRDCVEAYQEFNTNPFGMGTCSTYAELTAGFGDDNSSVVRKRTLFGFYAPTVCMGTIRRELLHETSGKDHEQEKIVLDSVPLKQFLVATTPGYRKEFEAGLRVRNEMSGIHSDLVLPPYFNRRDMQDFPSIFGWLLEHDCEEAAQDLCRFVLKDKSSKSVSYLLAGDKFLISAATSLLKDAVDDDHADKLSMVPR